MWQLRVCESQIVESVRILVSIHEINILPIEEEDASITLSILMGRLRDGRK
jgi:hypothetical protein